MPPTDKLLWNDIVRIIFYRFKRHATPVFDNEMDGVDSNVTVTNHVITRANLLLRSIYD